MHKHPLSLRAQQLLFRHYEVYIAYSTFCRFIRNDPNLELETIDGLSFDRQSWIALDEPPVKFNESVVLTGHSFGGCTVVTDILLNPFMSPSLLLLSSPYSRLNL